MVPSYSIKLTYNLKPELFIRGEVPRLVVSDVTECAPYLSRGENGPGTRMVLGFCGEVVLFGMRLSRLLCGEMDYCIRLNAAVKVIWI